MVDEDDLGVVALRDLPDQLDEAFRLSLGQSRPRLIEQDDARAADDALCKLDQTAFEHCQLTATAIRVLEADERQRLTDAGVVGADLVGRHQDVVVRRQRVDHLLLLERPAQSPSRTTVRGHAEQARAIRLDDTG